MNNWFYEGNEVNDISQLPDDTFGFIYKLQHTKTGKFYIGKKNLYSERNVKLGKKELAALTDKRSSKKKKVKKESDWKTYFGSEATLKEDIKKHGSGNFCRKILHICFNKASLTYQELRYQILEGCLESDNCYNGNILGKFYKKTSN